MASKDKDALPQEFIQATKVFDEIISRGTYQRTKLTYECFFHSNAITVCKKSVKIRDIPSGYGWRWNQAKRRYSIKKEGYSYELLKLVPRKTPTSTLKTLPKLKLWRAVVLSGRCKAIILWCERGQDIPESTLNDIHLSDLTFLAPLMDRDTAIELWPELTMLEGMYSTNNIQPIMDQKIDFTPTISFQKNCYNHYDMKT